MKKLFVFALAGAASFVASAASFNWAIDKASEAELGYTVYAVLGDTAATSWASVEALAAASIGGASIGTVEQKGERAYGAGGRFDHESVAKDKNFYLVIVDAAESKFSSSQVYSGDSYVYTPPAESPGTASFSVAGVSYTTFGSEPIPEPTSGLLVLVGLAGLMLRRKRA